MVALRAASGPGRVMIGLGIMPLLIEEFVSLLHLMIVFGVSLERAWERWKSRDGKYPTLDTYVKESLGLFSDEVTPAPCEGQGIDYAMTFF